LIFCDNMLEKDEKQNKMYGHELEEHELDELFEEQIKKRDDPKHRGYGDYERKRIYRGPSVKRN